MLTALTPLAPGDDTACLYHSNRRATALSEGTDGEPLPICATCQTAARAVLARNTVTAGLLDAGDAITRDRADVLADQLTAASYTWPEVAATLPEIDHVIPAADVYRDRAVLGPLVAHDGHVYRSVLYRLPDTGQWWATGWSDASRVRVLQCGAHDAPLDDLAP